MSLIKAYCNNLPRARAIVAKRVKGDQYAIDEIIQDTAIRLMTPRKVNNKTGYIIQTLSNSTYEFYGKQSKLPRPMTDAQEIVYENTGEEHKFHATQEEDNERILIAAIEQLPVKRQQVVKAFLKTGTLVGIGPVYETTKAHYRQACIQLKDFIENGPKTPVDGRDAKGRFV